MVNVSLGSGIAEDLSLAGASAINYFTLKLLMFFGRVSLQAVI